MTKQRQSTQREEALSRESIIEASIALLDHGGEGGLTFRALSQKLATGPGAIYWHIANKTELLTAACDALIVRTMNEIATTTPEKTIRAVALGLFDVNEAHPWIGSALTSAPTASPVVHILERIGQQIRALKVPAGQQWAAVGTLMAFILGICRQNAANRHLARAQNLDRAHFLEAVSTAWSQLDETEYPFARSVAGRMRSHDDRADFISGIALVLAGITSPRPRPPARLKRQQK
jgi:AcrR family transcriptional regulator